MINEISNGIVMVSGQRPWSPIVSNVGVRIEVELGVKWRPAACT